MAPGAHSSELCVRGVFRGVPHAGAAAVYNSPCRGQAHVMWPCLTRDRVQGPQVYQDTLPGGHLAWAGHQAGLPVSTAARVPKSSPGLKEPSQGGQALGAFVCPSWSRMGLLRTPGVLLGLSGSQSQSHGPELVDTVGGCQGQFGRAPSSILESSSGGRPCCSHILPVSSPEQDLGVQLPIPQSPHSQTCAWHGQFRGTWWFSKFPGSKTEPQGLPASRRAAPRKVCWPGHVHVRGERRTRFTLEWSAGRGWSSAPLCCEHPGGEDLFW